MQGLQFMHWNQMLLSGRGGGDPVAWTVRCVLPLLLSPCSPLVLSPPFPAPGCFKASACAGRAEVSRARGGSPGCAPDCRISQSAACLLCRVPRHLHPPGPKSCPHTGWGTCVHLNSLLAWLTLMLGLAVPRHIKPTLGCTSAP